MKKFRCNTNIYQWLQIAFAIEEKAEKNEIYKAMRNSDFYVSPEARHAATYSINDVYGYDFEANEIVKKSLIN